MLVAVVLVALREATEGEDVPTTFPEESVERTESLLMLESESVVPVMLDVAVSVPTVKFPTVEDEMIAPPWKNMGEVVAE